MARADEFPRDRHPTDHEQVSIELVVALRGKRSRRQFSAFLGYKSNIVQRWETGTAFPKAAVFLDACERKLHCGLTSAYGQLFQRPAPWQDTDMEPRQALIAFLADLRGKRSIKDVAQGCGRNRFTVARWLNGEGEPTLPELLLLVDVMTGRLLDFLSSFTNPEHLPSVLTAWRHLEASRRLAYQSPWGHAILRTLCLDSCVIGDETNLVSWISERLDLPQEDVRTIFLELKNDGHVHWNGERWETTVPSRVNTGRQTGIANSLKEHWTATALTRLRNGAPGAYGYSLFEISRRDLPRLKKLHLEYVKAMLEIVESSSPTDCVGLYCAQLIDLSRMEEVKP